MATSYRVPTTNSSIGEGGAAPYNTPFSGVMQPICVPQDRKLLDKFRDKMRSLPAEACAPEQVSLVMSI